jgi:hypothetical protein
MRCLACGAEMLLMEVVQDEAMRAPAFERRTFMCSACRQIARRLVFSRVTTSANVPVATSHPEASAAKLQMGQCAALGAAWAKAVEKLSSRQTALKESAAAARTA